MLSVLCLYLYHDSSNLTGNQGSYSSLYLHSRVLCTANLVSRRLPFMTLCTTMTSMASWPITMLNFHTDIENSLLMMFCLFKSSEAMSHLLSQWNPASALPEKECSCLSTHCHSCPLQNTFYIIGSVCEGTQEEWYTLCCIDELNCYYNHSYGSGYVLV